MPEVAVIEDLANDVALVGLDEGDDLHAPAAASAPQRVGMVDAIDEHGPAAAIKAGRRRGGRSFLLGWCGAGLVSGRCGLTLGSEGFGMIDPLWRHGHSL